LTKQNKIIIIQKNDPRYCKIKKNLKITKTIHQNTCKNSKLNQKFVQKNTKIQTQKANLKGKKSPKES